MVTNTKKAPHYTVPGMTDLENPDGQLVTEDAHLEKTAAKRGKR